MVREGQGIALLCFGTLLAACKPVAEALNATLVDMRFVKPLDEALVRQLASSHGELVTIEENVVAGGAGSAINELLASDRLRPAILNIGLPDEFIKHGAADEILHELGLDSAGIASQIERWRDQVS